MARPDVLLVSLGTTLGWRVADRMLLGPERPPPSLHFFERTYPHDELLSPALFQLRAACVRREPEPGTFTPSIRVRMQ